MCASSNTHTSLLKNSELNREHQIEEPNRALLEPSIRVTELINIKCKCLMETLHRNSVKWLSSARIAFRSNLSA